MKETNKKNYLVTEGPIIPILIKLTLPSIFGIISIILFNIVDTFFIGKLGVLELTAISFTFPVVIVVNSFNLGIAIAVMNLFARDAGQKNYKAQRQLATSSLLIGLIISFIITSVGYWSIEPLFKFLGANPEVLPLIKDYMSIWYLGSIFVVIPMIGGHILRGLGDTKTPSIIMFASGLLNCFLDPLFIFGWKFIPSLGVKGAALATVSSRMMAIFVSLYIQVMREKLISFKGLTPKIIIDKWKIIFSLAIPNILIKIATPLLTTFFTWILASYGNQVVAGYGVAVKIEMFFLTIAIALSITSSIFVGQNIGAKKFSRAEKGLKILNLFSFILGIGYFIILSWGGSFLGSFFNQDPLVQKTIATYFLILPISYSFFSIIQINFSVLNVLKKSLQIDLLLIFKIFLLNIPLAFLLNNFFLAKGVFWSIVISLTISGILTLATAKFYLKKEKEWASL